MSQLADIWQAPIAAEAASNILCLMTDSFPISEIHSLPEVLKASCTFSAVVAAAEVALLSIFGNAPHIITSPPLLQRFFRLPHSALLALLQSPKLATDTEESVLLLVSGWCEEPMGHACSAAQVDALNSEIRYGILSCTCLTHICDLLTLPKLDRGQLLELWRHSCMRGESSNRRWGDLNPAQWYLPQRPTVTQDTSGAKIRLLIAEADLRVLLAAIGNVEAEVVHKSTPVYAAGFMWTLELSVYKGVLWCAVNAQGLSSIRVMDQPVPIFNGITCSSRIVIEAAAQFELHQAYYQSFDTDGTGVLMVGPEGRHQGSAQIEWWADYIVDGSVCLRALMDQD